MSEVYELKGTERMEKTTEPVDCGDCIQTSYFDDAAKTFTNPTGLVRRDIEIVVDLAKLPKLTGEVTWP